MAIPALAGNQLLSQETTITTNDSPVPRKPAFPLGLPRSSYRYLFPKREPCRKRLLDNLLKPQQAHEADTGRAMATITSLMTMSSELSRDLISTASRQAWGRFACEAKTQGSPVAPRMTENYFCRGARKRGEVQDPDIGARKGTDVRSSIKLSDPPLHDAKLSERVAGISGYDRANRDVLSQRVVNCSTEVGVRWTAMV